jgi:hypothetical protein
LKKGFQIFFSTLLLLSISWQCCAKTVIYFNFKRQQQKLAETVCENKDIAGSCCKAKCYLDKELKKEEKRQSDLPASIKDKTEKSEIVSGLLSFVSITYAVMIEHTFTYTDNLPEHRAAAVFHPPTPA